MAQLLATSSLGNSLQQLLMADDIVPGQQPGYQTCKAIYLFHPLGAKICDKPLQLAQSQQREISIPASPEERLKEVFQAEWERLGEGEGLKIMNSGPRGADRLIFELMSTARRYGAAVLIMGQPGKNNLAVSPADYLAPDIYFSVFDPLNVAGSLVLSQNPNAPDFLKKLGNIRCNGEEYHPSRCCLIFNETPIYLDYQSSGYGYTGRSVYQRILYPLKTFIQSMKTDDMVTLKAGVLVAKMKSPGSIISNIMQAAANVKRSFVKEAVTDNVLSIGIDEDIAALNLINTDTAMTTARKNVLDNIASGAPMPAKLLNDETFAEGFGEGTEDARMVSIYVDGIRRDMAHPYAWADRIVQRRAWNEEFYKSIQADFPDEYGKVDYQTAFYQWSNNFVAPWPKLIKDPKEEAKEEETRCDTIEKIVEAWAPMLDPENKARLMEWGQNNLNAQKLVFPVEMNLDFEALAAYEPPLPQAAPGEEPQAKPGRKAA